MSKCPLQCHLPPCVFKTKMGGYQISSGLHNTKLNSLHTPPPFSDGSFSDDPFFQHLSIIPRTHSFNTCPALSTSLLF